MPLSIILNLPSASAGRRGYRGYGVIGGRRCASKFNCPTLVIRVVSDKADDNAHTDFTESLEDVCQRVTPDILAIMRTAIDALQD